MDAHLIVDSFGTLACNITPGVAPTLVTSSNAMTTCDDCKIAWAKYEADQEAQAEERKVKKWVREVLVEERPRHKISEATFRSQHALIEQHIMSDTEVAYKCSCGFHGRATKAPQLSSTSALTSAAKQNHEMHRARAYVRYLANGEF